VLGQAGAVLRQLSRGVCPRGGRASQARSDDGLHRSARFGRLLGISRRGPAAAAVPFAPDARRGRRALAGAGCPDAGTARGDVRFPGARRPLHGRSEMLRSLERQGVMVLDTVPDRLTVDAVNRYLAIKTGVRT